MAKLFLLLVQPVTGSVIVIVLLLIVAGVIGFLTAWFYAKSVYTPVVKGLESEKANLEKEVDDLTAGVKKLRDKVEKLGVRVKDLESEVAEKERELNLKTTR
jgi:uncharacterized protein YlxW (UPF0749 family)